MATSRIPLIQRDITYSRFAREYLASLPMEHFMEATPQGVQREITLASLALVKRRHPNVQYFNELLVQYPIRGQRRPGQVVPDNLVILHDTPLNCDTYYATDIHPSPPFWALEYVSRNSERKDYERNMEIYEQLRFQYYLIFYPGDQELTLFRLNSRRTFRAVVPNRHERVPLVELNLEIGLLNGWARFWYQGMLLELPAQLENQLDQAREELTETREELTETREELTETREELTEAREELTETREELTETRNELTEARQQLAERDRRMAEMAREMARLRNKQPPQ